MFKFIQKIFCKLGLHDVEYLHTLTFFAYGRCRACGKEGYIDSEGNLKD